MTLSEERAAWVPSPGLLLLASSTANEVVQQSADFGVSLDDLLVGERYAAEEVEEPWVVFVQASFEPDARLRRRRRKQSISHR